jgi:hypothetical protein
MRPTGATFTRVCERDEGKCASCGEEVWGDRGFHFSLHHQRPESHRCGNLVLLHGSGTTGCHGHVERERAESYRLGLLVREPFTPALQPIRHAVHGLVLLSDDGSWRAVETVEVPDA